MTGAKNQPVTAEEKENRKQSASNAERLSNFFVVPQSPFVLKRSNQLNASCISSAQVFLLGCLGNEDYLTLLEIRGKMGHSCAAATGMVDRLEKLGYVQRLRAAEDRRKVIVQMTRKGIVLVGRQQLSNVHEFGRRDETSDRLQ